MYTTNSEEFRQFEEDINRVWTHKLLGEFYTQNANVFHKLHLHLPDPNFN